MSNDPAGYELPLRLLGAFRVLVDAVHAELARAGHPELRPMHGFVFQAIGPRGTTAVEASAGASASRSRRRPSTSTPWCGWGTWNGRRIRSTRGARWSG